MHELLKKITANIEFRSKVTRVKYLDKIEKAKKAGPHRQVLPCGNLAHGFAACAQEEKNRLRGMSRANIAIISAYNDMLSAHQPYVHYPQLIKEAIFAQGGTAQFAGGVPAMCDGITQGQAGMELSLMSRDIIALSTAVALSHNMFDGALMLGICDKIVPGLLIAALTFGHLPVILIPAGPMPSGIPNHEKAKIRQLYAEGKIDRDKLLDAESRSYHAPGTCTFYGTANSNQLIVEIMGLQLPGSSFVNPSDSLRQHLTIHAAQQIVTLTALQEQYLPIADIVDTKTIVNGMVGLLATGGSTNHTIHMIAIARAAGIIINWDDFAQLSAITPLLARIYPNGEADINQFQQAGGMPFLIRNLLEAGLLHEDVNTIVGRGLARYTREPKLTDLGLEWIEAPISSKNESVLRSFKQPFQTEGGINLLIGNLGRAIFKNSAVPEDRLVIEAPAVVFYEQKDFLQAFQSGALNKNCVVILRYQGPKACGMPELHQLTPALGVLQDRGYAVALVTDGRMSGASGKVPAAIHVTPEAIAGGLIAIIEDGDMILLDAKRGYLQLLLSEAEIQERSAQLPSLTGKEGCGRELFRYFREGLSAAELGASCLFNEGGMIDV